MAAMSREQHPGLGGEVKIDPGAPHGAFPDLEDLPPVPGRGRVFVGAARGRLGDVTPSGRVRMDALARWLQDVAYDDVADAGLAQAGSWVVRRTRLLVRRFPRFDETVTLQTFCSGIGPRWAQRRTTLRGDGGAEIEADALWIFLDWETLLPARFDSRFHDVYGEAAAGRRAARARARHSPPPEAAPRFDWRFRASDTDLADHVNNAAYWEVLEERFSRGVGPVAVDAEIEYRDPGQPGPARVAHDADGLWITDTDGTVLASIMVSAFDGG
jgi:acyl-ACP thioesterase